MSLVNGKQLVGGFFAFLLCWLAAPHAQLLAQSQATQTLLTTQTPQNVNLSDGASINYELGLRFLSDTAGEVTGIRFWKASNETGSHTGTLWSASGALLASVSFTGETASGWQEQLLATPVTISANMEYVVSVNTANTYYVVTGGGLSQQITNQNLRSVVGSNGVFGNPGQFPTGSYLGGNYFRDVVFRPAAAGSLVISGSVLPASLGSAATLTLTGAASQTGTADASGVYQFTALSNGTYTITPSKTGFRFIPASQTITLNGSSATGIDFTALAAQTLFTNQVPALDGQNEGISYELGMRFTSAISGQIHAVRFWKATGETGQNVGKIWSASGNLLASVTFTNETASGWQEQALATPLPIVASSEYVVSVNTGGGFYATTGSGLAQQIVNQNLRSVQGHNGVYALAGAFPTGSFLDSNYFRDVVMTDDTQGGLNRFSISGNLLPAASGSGASVAMSGDASLTITADASGAFNFTGIPNGSYLLKPAKSGYRFSPSSLPITVSGANVSGVSFSSVLAESIFTTQVPSTLNANDGVSYEMGVRFTSALAGQIQAVRFWKSQSETSVHTGRLWSSSGTLLAAVTFQSETASGWQEQAFTSPVPIAANVEYTISVNTGGTSYVATSGGLSQQVVNGNLRTLVGSNGVYGSVGAFPSLSYQNGNYFRDVVLTQDTSPLPNRFAISGVVTPAGVGSGVTLKLSGNAGMTATSDSAGNFSFSGLPSGSYTVTPSKQGYAFTPQTLSVTVAGGDVTGANFAGSLKQTLFTIQTPTSPSLSDGKNYEFGLRWKSDVPATVAGVRFWKASAETTGHVGKLWSSTGQLLTSVTFQNETASGWQEQFFSSPYPIVAGVVYVVSVNTTNNRYAATSGGLAQEIINLPLHSVVGQNGVYGNSGLFPTSSYQGGNYFRDLVLTGDTTPRFSISGAISPAANGSGTILNLTGDTLLTATADSSGNFAFGGLPNGTYTVTPQKSGYLFTPGSRTVTVNGANVSGVSYTASPLPPSETIFTTQTPAQTNANDGVAYELGTKFYAVTNGQIIAIRFWKAAAETNTHVGRIWSANGQLLASAAFSGETASGWQEQALTTPVNVTVNTQYCVSVNTGGTLYVATDSALAQQVSNGNLRTVTGVNGAYGASGQQPWQGLTANYFRDVKFIATAVPPTGLKISGSVSPSDMSGGITMAITGAAITSVLTGTSGSYIAGGLPSGSFTVTPSKPGFTFTPASRAVTLTTTDATGIDFTAQAVNPIVAENARVGTSAWQLVNQAETGEIEGYAGPTTVNRGEAVTFYISSAGAPYTLDVYRLGWYGGLGARLMHTAGSLAGQSQPVCSPDPDYGLSDCTWSPSYTLTTGTTWTSGLYVAKVRLTSSGKENHVWFTVRDDASTANVYYQSSVTTIQAYNAYGGKSVYSGKCSDVNPLTQSSSSAAVKVSFNRPYQPWSRYATPSKNPYLDQHLRWDCAWIRWLESQGYNTSYSNNLDTHYRGQKILQHSMFVSAGHDEYWSSQMRNNAEAAFAAGVNMAFFSANAMYWQVRLESSPNGGPNPVVVSYKASAPAFDPLVNDPALSTRRFRDDPTNRPENRFLGVMYGWDTTSWTGYPLVVTNSSHALYRNTGLTNGSSLYGMVGYEWDNLDGVSVSPADPASISGLAVLSNSPTTSGSYQSTTFYQGASGAKMFAAGTINWCWGLDNFNSAINSQDNRVRQITTNVFVDLGATPATPSAGIVVSP